MNWTRNRPRSESILAIMLGVVIIGSGVWSLAVYIGNATGWW